MTDKNLRQMIMKDAISLEVLGVNEYAWQKQHVLALITSLMNENITILGGDVYVTDTSGRIIPSSESWSCSIEAGESRESFCYRSKKEALAYIRAFPNEAVNGNFLFSLVFSENIG